MITTVATRNRRRAVGELPIACPSASSFGISSPGLPARVIRSGSPDLARESIDSNAAVKPTVTG